jgi:hypothetical protein
MTRLGPPAMSAFAPLLEAPTQGARQSLFVIPGIEDAIVATHMEALDHATVTRAGLRRYAAEQGVTRQQLLIPEDGGELEFTCRARDQLMLVSLVRAVAVTLRPLRCPGRRTAAASLLRSLRSIALGLCCLPKRTISWRLHA